MKYLSVCSGIEAATVAWHPLGWEPVAFSEIEKFPRRVLQQRLRVRDARRGVRDDRIPLWGDFTTMRPRDFRRLGIDSDIDLLVGGTPCQSFSIAGLRQGMSDARGNLTLEFLRLARRFRPRWVVWENVPGVLSSNDGRDFGTFLQGLAEIGYGWAYRVMDAQYVRVGSHPRAIPQRRRRVFVVAYRGNWARAGSVLLERASLSGHSPPRRNAIPSLTVSNQEVAQAEKQQEQHSRVSNKKWPKNVASTLDTFGGSTENQHALGGASRFVLEYINSKKDLSFDSYNQATSPIHHTLRTSSPLSDAVLLAKSAMIRRLTPRECERLQGFPDGWTRIAWRGKSPENCVDSPRYQALGNSMAVNVMRWLGERITLVDALNETSSES